MKQSVPYDGTPITSFRLISIWDKVFKNGPSEICGRQPLKNLKLYGLLKGDSHNVLKVLQIRECWQTKKFFPIPYFRNIFSQ